MRTILTLMLFLVMALPAAAQQMLLYGNLKNGSGAPRTNVIMTMNLVAPRNFIGMSSDQLQTTTDTNGNFLFTNNTPVTVLWALSAGDSSNTRWPIATWLGVAGSNTIWNLVDWNAVIPSNSQSNYFSKAEVLSLLGTNSVGNATNVNLAPYDLTMIINTNLLSSWTAQVNTSVVATVGYVNATAVTNNQPVVSVGQVTALGNMVVTNTSNVSTIILSANPGAGGATRSISDNPSGIVIESILFAGGDVDAVSVLANNFTAIGSGYSGPGPGLTGLEVGNFATNNSVAAPTPMQFVQWNGSAFQFGTASGGGGSATNAIALTNGTGTVTTLINSPSIGVTNINIAGTGTAATVSATTFIVTGGATFTTVTNNGPLTNAGPVSLGGNLVVGGTITGNLTGTLTNNTTGNAATATVAISSLTATTAATAINASQTGTAAATNNAGPVSFTNANNTMVGTFTGNGTGLTSLPLYAVTTNSALGTQNIYSGLYAHGNFEAFNIQIQSAYNLQLGGSAVVTGNGAAGIIMEDTTATSFGDLWLGPDTSSWPQLKVTGSPATITVIGGDGIGNANLDVTGNIIGNGSGLTAVPQQVITNSGTTMISSYARPALQLYQNPTYEGGNTNSYWMVGPPNSLPDLWIERFTNGAAANVFEFTPEGPFVDTGGFSDNGASLPNTNNFTYPVIASSIGNVINGYHYGSGSNLLLAPNTPTAGYVLSATDSTGTNHSWIVQSGGGGATNVYVATANPAHIAITTNSSSYWTFDLGSDAVLTNPSAPQTIYSAITLGGLTDNGNLTNSGYANFAGPDTNWGNDVIKGTLTANLIGSLTNNTTGNAATATFATNALCTVTNAQLVFNVTNYGAIGNDTVDCTTAFTNAFALAAAVNGIVEIPAAANMYKITQIITFPTNTSGQINLTIQGDGPVASRIDEQITFTSNLYTNGAFFVYGTTSAGFVRIKDLGFYNNNNGLAAIYDQYPRIQIDNCAFDVAGGIMMAGVIIGGTNNVPTGYLSSINNCYFNSCTNAIRLQDDANGVKLDHNFVAGTSLLSPAAIVIDGTLIGNSTFTSAQYDEAINNTIEMQGCTNGFYLNGAVNCRIAFNAGDDSVSNISQAFIYENTNTIANTDIGNTFNTVASGTPMVMFTDASWNQNSGQGSKYIGNDHLEGPSWGDYASFLGFFNAPFFQINTNQGTTAPAAVVGVISLWNSNSVLCGVSQLGTNQYVYQGANATFGNVTANLSSSSNYQYMASPDTNFLVSGIGAVASNTVSTAFKIIGTNLNTFDGIGILTGTNNWIDFSQTHWDWKISTNVWINGASNLVSGSLFEHTMIDIFNTNTAGNLTVTTLADYTMATNTITTNSATVPYGHELRVLLDYNGVMHSDQRRQCSLLMNLKILLLFLCFIGSAVFAQSDNYYDEQVVQSQQIPLISSGGGGGGSNSHPVYYNSTSNALTSGATSYTTPSLSNGGNNPMFLLNVAWYSSADTVTIITNNLGVSGTVIATNFWYSTTGTDKTYYWTNSAMINVTVHFSAGPSEISYFFVQLQGPTSNPRIGAFGINNYLVGTATGVVITNIVSNATYSTNSLLVEFSTENSAGASEPTNGVPPITTIGGVGISGNHWETAAYKAGDVSVTNTVVWGDASASTYDLTSISVNP